MKYIKFILLNVALLLFFFNFQVKAQEVVCLDCHENLVENTVHNKVIKCGDCHRDINTTEHGAGSAKKVNCANCHAALNNQMNHDVHRNVFNVDEKDAPNCKSCHGTHKIKSPSKIENKQKEYCSKCHKTDVLKSVYHTKSEKDYNCNKCHNDALHKNNLAKSVHHSLSCSNCHSYVVNNIDNHRKAPKDGILADCYICHNAIANEHKESIHGISILEGINEAAQCWDCHGSHSIDSVSNKNSLVYSTNLVSTCGKCHDNPDFTKKHAFAIKSPGKMYSQSVHGKLVANGTNAATCITCHGKHNIKNRIQEGSKIASTNIPGTCEECHAEITKEYKQSIHWIGVKKGIREAPSCNDCHSEHNIHQINTADKREEIKRIQSQTCLECHNNLMLSERYGMSGNSAGNYEDSYHGLAASRGEDKAALCVDCHGVHKILPKSHAESSINKNNITATCKKCHEKANEIFSISYSHTTQLDSAKNIEDIVTFVYFWLIVIVVGWMFVHNLLILIHELRKRYKKSKNEIRIPRFTTNELIQHTVLLVSFIVLAISGFQLKYPDSAFGKGLYALGMDENIRQWVHRISAIVMMALSVYHAIYLVITARGRDVLKGLFPNFSDLTQLINNSLFYLHLKKKQPEFDNYNYMEKMEYWALIWGTLVMGATGIVLWFPTIGGDWAPVWFIKVSEIIHFYEAILATLAIVVWHWFFVIFHPKEYPLNFICIDGEITIHHFKEEHKLKFYKVIIEWLEVKKGIRTPKKMNHYTKLFIKAVEKGGVTMESLVNSELNKDENLKAMAEKQNLI
ncbi:MAG: cytochrome b/b6 domain-containing protein [Bacteroidia bacterium]|nr:cytochrome b/b6 domain-containing protein [Bacteroidia bacterium]